MVKVHDIDGNTFDVTTQSLSFRPAVYGVIVRDKSVLLMQVKDKFWLPGGGVEPGENHLDTLRREVREETGLSVQPVQLLDVYSSMYRSFTSTQNYHSIQMFYICKIVADDGKPSLTPEERAYLKPARWVQIAQLHKYPYAGIEPIFHQIQQHYR